MREPAEIFQLSFPYINCSPSNIILSSVEPAVPFRYFLLGFPVLKPLFLEKDLRRILTICFLLSNYFLHAQTLGGNAVYNFLQLPSTPLLTAAGGVNVSYKTNEVGLTANNPALLSPDVHAQINLSFNSFISGIKTYSLTGAYQSSKLNTIFGAHIYFVDYGFIAQTDAAGNQSGSFRPQDFVVQVSASRKYLDKWSGGLTLKFISSNWQQYSSSALALDAGILYVDSLHNFSASLLARNMGLQLKAYGSEKEDLPFDLQIGITKRLQKAPLGFSLTAQHLNVFNTLYNDTTFNSQNDLSSGNGFFNKLLNHFVLATHIYLGNHLEATVGYNHLRRSELNAGNSDNGLNGFSMGFRIRFEKLQVLYARSNYQRNLAYNQLGISIQLNRLFGMSEL